MNYAPKSNRTLITNEDISPCNSIGEVAVKYAANGWPVFPCRENGKKVKAPYTKNGFKDATTNQVQIKQWWHQHPNALIGFPTGTETGILVIDCDVRQTGNGTENYKQLLSDHQIKDFPCILTVNTPSGGVHYYYRQPPVSVPIKSKLTDYVDIKADGGYVIAPGSKLADGRKYTWARGLDPLVRNLRCPPSGLLNIIQKTAPAETIIPYPQSTNLDEIKIALGYIPASDYLKWLDIGMALKAGLGDEGYAIWDQWSKTFPEKYDQKEQRKTWVSFKGHGIKIETVFHYAKQHGCNLSELAKEKRKKEKPLASAKTYCIDHQSEKTPPSNERSYSSLIPVDLNLSVSLRDDWLIEDMFFSGDLALLVGKKSVGKSFIAIDLATCLATGSSWASQSVKQCPVLYHALEGERGIKKRFLAQAEINRSAFENRTIPLAIETSPLDLCSAHAEADLMNAVFEFEETYKSVPSLIIIDTLSQVFGGDENSSEPMRNCLKNVKAVIRKTEASILLIHHFGKDVKYGPRGHSSLEAACDTIFYLEKNRDGIVFSEHKQKDADCSFQTRVELIPTTLESKAPGSDKPITTCLPAYSNTSKKGDGIN